MAVVGEITYKYLRSFGRSGSAKLMTVISAVGIAIAVATLTITVSVADGFGSAYRKAILDFNAHVMLTSAGEMTNPDEILEVIAEFGNEVVAVSPFIYREGLIVFNGQIRGVVIKGVDPAQFEKMSGTRLALSSGPNGAGKIVLGNYLASELGVKDGDEIKVLLPEGSETGKDAYKSFKITGTFSSGMYDFDSSFAMLDIATAQETFKIPDTITGVEIKITDPEKAELFAKRLEGAFAYPVTASHWKDLNFELFEAIKMEKLMFALVMGSLLVVAAFNIIGTVLLKVLYKTTDIAILRALGMKKKDLRKIFMFQGLIVGVVGTISGLIIAFGLSWLISRYEWIKIPQEIYLIKTLPVCISWSTVIVIATASCAVSFLTSYIASGRVVGMRIIKGLHRAG